MQEVKPLFDESLEAGSPNRHVFHNDVVLLAKGEYLTIAAINRCSAPGSKSKLGRWFARDWLATRYAVNPKVFNAKTYWNHFQYIALDPWGTTEVGEDPSTEKVPPGETPVGEVPPDLNLIPEIELGIAKAVVERFGLDLSGVLYDSTNFFTFSQGGRGNGSTILHFGHSKQNRNGNRLVAYWVLCTRGSGVPIMHETYPGNRQDAEVFKSALPRVGQRLQALGGNPADITIVFDNGNLSPEGFAKLEESELRFIASHRPSEHKELLNVPLTEFTEVTLPNGKTAEYYYTTAQIYGAERTTYVVLDPAAQEKRVVEFRLKISQKIKAIRTHFEDEGRLDPAAIAGKKGQGQKWFKRAEVEKKVAAMVGKAPFKKVIVASVTGPARVVPRSRERLALSVTVNAGARKAHEETLGKSVVFTNQDDWAPEDVLWAFREKYVVEHAFERMKCPSSIAVRPMYHHADLCVRGHVFICILALLLQSLLRLKVSRKKVATSYTEMLEALATVQAFKIRATPATEPVWKLCQATGKAAQISKVLGLKNLLPP